MSNGMAWVDKVLNTGAATANLLVLFSNARCHGRRMALLLEVFVMPSRGLPGRTARSAGWRYLLPPTPCATLHHKTSMVHSHYSLPQRAGLFHCPWLACQRARRHSHRAAVIKRATMAEPDGAAADIQRLEEQVDALHKQAQALNKSGRWAGGAVSCLCNAVSPRRKAVASYLDRHLAQLGRWSAPSLVSPTIQRPLVRLRTRRCSHSGWHCERRGTCQ